MAAIGSRWQFTEEEIRSKLRELGYNNIPDKALKEFSNDLHQLIATENAKESLAERDSSSSPTSTLDSPASTTSSELTMSHEDTPRHETPYQYGIPLKLNGEGLDHYQNATSYPIKDEENQNYGQFVRGHSSRYIASDKENQMEDNHETTLRLAQKRKVLRRKDGTARVFDESFASDTQATDISDVERRLQNLPLKDKTDNASTHSCQSEGSSVWQQWGRNRNVLPSYIRPKSGDPRTCGVKKTDPVNRYHQFKHEWTTKKVPGEKTHKSLRWLTRAQMLQYETFEKPRHNYTPNNYVAPTDKKRQALRWEVRSTLANT